MPTYLIKQKGLPPTWGSFSEDRLSLSFTLRARATEFPTPDAAMEAFEAACGAMWDKVLAVEAKKAAREAAAGRRVAAEPAYPRGNGPGPAWLMRKMGRLVKGWGGGRGDVEVDTAASAEEAAQPMVARYVKSELGWLGGPATKAAWGGHDWHLDFSKATPFMDELAAQNALKMARAAVELNFFQGRCEFVEARLDPKARDGESLAIAAAVESRALASELAPTLGAQSESSATAGRRPRI